MGNICADNTIVIEAYQMTDEDDPGAVVNEVLDGWDGGTDAGVVGDVLAVVEGHVEVGTHEDAFPLEVRCGEIAHALLLGHRRRGARPAPGRRRRAAARSNVDRQPRVGASAQGNGAQRPLRRARGGEARSA